MDRLTRAVNIFLRHKKAILWFNNQNFGFTIGFDPLDGEATLYKDGKKLPYGKEWCKKYFITERMN